MVRLALARASKVWHSVVMLRFQMLHVSAWHLPTPTSMFRAIRSDAPNNDRINMYQLMGYGSYAIDPQHRNQRPDRRWYQHQRRSTAPSVLQERQCNIELQLVGCSLSGSVSLAALPLSESTIFTPEVRVDYTWVSADDYTEGGAGPLSLNTKSTSFESLLDSA